MYVGEHVHASVHTEVRGQFMELYFFLSPCGPQGGTQVTSFWSNCFIWLKEPTHGSSSHSNSVCYLHSFPGLCCSQSHHVPQTWKAGIPIFITASFLSNWHGLPRVWGELHRANSLEPSLKNFHHLSTMALKTVVEHGPLGKKTDAYSSYSFICL